MSEYESIYPDIPVPMPLSAFAPSAPPLNAIESSMDAVKGAIPREVRVAWQSTFVKIIVHTLTGVICGSIIDKITGLVLDRKSPDKWKLFLRLVIQWILSIGFLIICEMVIPDITDDWINTVGGITFPALYFGVQTGFFEDWSRVFSIFIPV